MAAAIQDQKGNEYTRWRFVMNARSIWFYVSLLVAASGGYGISTYNSPSQADLDRAIANAENISRLECPKPAIAQAKGAFRNSRDGGL